MASQAVSTTYKPGAEPGRRNLDDVRVTVQVPCCALTDGDHARELVRHHIAFYVGAMGVVYRDHLARQGYEAEAEEIARLWVDDQRDTAMAAVSADLFDSLGVAGTPDGARQQLDQWEALRSVDVVAVLRGLRLHYRDSKQLRLRHRPEPTRDTDRVPDYAATTAVGLTDENDLPDSAADGIGGFTEPPRRGGLGDEKTKPKGLLERSNAVSYIPTMINKSVCHMYPK